MPSDEQRLLSGQHTLQRRRQGLDGLPRLRAHEDGHDPQVRDEVTQERKLHLEAVLGKMRPRGVLDLRALLQQARRERLVHGDLAQGSLEGACRVDTHALEGGAVRWAHEHHRAPRPVPQQGVAVGRHRARV